MPRFFIPFSRVHESAIYENQPLLHKLNGALLKQFATLNNSNHSVL